MADPDLTTVDTPYQETAIKYLPSGGRVVIYGPKRATIEEAEAGLKQAMREYMATGAWGGGR